ncbi:MAG: hypothetical protein DIJKHBIC_03767 [Thermoanaerobaculia bacterium]|nr:hypothetical protein [Thermoanaerobaculia bacterium]
MIAILPISLIAFVLLAVLNRSGHADSESTHPSRA